MEPTATTPASPLPPVPPETSGHPVAPFPKEDEPNYDLLITEDDTPVDNFFVEKQQRLLTEPLNSCWPGPGEGRPFVAASNVGVFFEAKNPAFVPDMFLSLDVRLAKNLMLKPNRSYFCWVFGKVPDVILEIVSDRTGGEETYKMDAYCRMLVPFYVIYDPLEHLGNGVLRAFRMQDRGYQPMSPDLFPGIGLGLRQWQGVYEEFDELWLRWCDKKGDVIPTGREQAKRQKLKTDKERRLAEQERARAEQEHARAEQESARAEQESARAEQERVRAESAHLQAEQLREQLRKLGIDPSA